MLSVYTNVINLFLKTTDTESRHGKTNWYLLSWSNYYVGGKIALGIELKTKYTLGDPSTTDLHPRSKDTTPDQS